MKTPLTGALHPRPCPLCKTDDGRFVAERQDGGRWLACPVCELVYLSPCPDEEALARFYASYYTDYRALRLPTRAALESSARARVLDPLTQFALQTMGRVPARVADVGCGQGARLCLLRALGASLVVGSEMDGEAAKIARERYDVTVHVGSASAIVVPEGGFDIVFLSEVIEHVLDPVALLRSIRGLLAPNGFFFLSTPNAGVRHRAGAGWKALSLDFDHVSLFNDASIRRVLGEAGFAALEVLPLGRPAESSERWQQGAQMGALLRGVMRAQRVASRVVGNLRTPRVELDPHDGYVLLASARGFYPSLSPQTPLPPPLEKGR